MTDQSTFTSKDFADWSFFNNDEKIDAGKFAITLKKGIFEELGKEVAAVVFNQIMEDKWFSIKEILENGTLKCEGFLGAGMTEFEDKTAVDFDLDLREMLNLNGTELRYSWGQTDKYAAALTKLIAEYEKMKKEDDNYND